MRERRRARGAVGGMIAAALLLSAWAPAAPSPPARRGPRLVVVLVADQMRADYVEQFGPRWKSGLKRLIDQGAWFRNAAYPYANTVTCAGHATIGTGALPVKHQIAGNVWWDRQAARLVTCTGDAQARAISYGAPVALADSPLRLAVPTLAEEMRRQLGPGARTVTVSLKARSAIMLAGHRGDAVTWFDTPSGSWLTSSAFTDTPVPFVQEFVKSHPLAPDLQASWTRLRPPSDYLYADDGVGERPYAGGTSAFPHAIRAAGASKAATFLSWETSPLADAYTAGLARAAVDALHLGQGPATDFLGVSFSALDVVGHRYGPKSHEVQDILFRLDATLGELLDHLDRVVGRDAYVVGFSSDHGVALVPEQEKAEGHDAGRVVAEEVASRIDRALAPALGAGPHIVQASYSDLYFAPGEYVKVAGDPALLKTVLDTILATPGVARVIRPEDLASVGKDDAITQAVARSYVAHRSGDLVVIPKPGWIVVSALAMATGQATTHGSPNIYDRRVPVILMGPGIQAGARDEAASPADLAPTLAHLIGIQLPSADGRVLAEAFATSTVSARAPPPAARGRSPRP